MRDRSWLRDARTAAGFLFGPLVRGMAYLDDLVMAKLIALCTWMMQRGASRGAIRFNLWIAYIVSFLVRGFGPDGILYDAPEIGAVAYLALGVFGLLIVVLGMRAAFDYQVDQLFRHSPTAMTPLDNDRNAVHFRVQGWFFAAFAVACTLSWFFKQPDAGWQSFMFRAHKRPISDASEWVTSLAMFGQAALCLTRPPPPKKEKERAALFNALEGT